jgi:KUP system potassium uptake protein
LAEQSSAAAPRTEPKVSRATLIAALGVVFGDIGTSPLYAFRESLRNASAAGGAPADSVLGLLSLIFWALILVVTVKYVLIVLRATNEGEGGIMAITALAANTLASERWRRVVLTIGLVGVALFYGDCILTPAISVLSAVEGLNVATPVFQPYVVPIAAGILGALFFIQSGGTARIGGMFGPVMAAWFALLAISGIVQIVQQPHVLTAIDPRHGIVFLETHGPTGLYVLGAVFLAVTGTEALYADVGHFSPTIIRVDWGAIVLPGVVLNYFGQGALVLSHPQAIEHPFFYQFHGLVLYPALALATAATVTASQASITGAFTLSQQAMQLRFLPRLEVRFTSKTHMGQIYVPQVNWLLGILVLTLVLTFQSSSALAAAYGIAVAGTMLGSTALIGIVAYHCWKWPLPFICALVSMFLVVDLTFFGANLLKVWEGGWIPLLIGAAVFLLMSTWQRGRSAMLERLAAQNAPLEAFWKRMNCDALPRVPGTAIYLTSQSDTAPSALALNVKHNKVLHKNVVLLTVITERVPRVPLSRRVSCEKLEEGFRRVTLRYGFAETPNVPRSLRNSDRLGFDFKENDISYFIGREVPIGSPRPDLAAWREPIFAFLTKNAGNAADFFCIPPEKVVELGTQVEV